MADSNTITDAAAAATSSSDSTDLMTVTATATDSTDLASSTATATPAATTITAPAATSSSSSSGSTDLATGIIVLLVIIGVVVFFAVGLVWVLIRRRKRRRRQRMLLETAQANVQQQQQQTYPQYEMQEPLPDAPPKEAPYLGQLTPEYKSEMPTDRTAPLEKDAGDTRQEIFTPPKIAELHSPPPPSTEMNGFEAPPSSELDGSYGSLPPGPGYDASSPMLRKDHEQAYSNSWKRRDGND